jgi:hypothetical protein
VPHGEEPDASTSQSIIDLLANSTFTIATYEYALIKAALARSGHDPNFASAIFFNLNPLSISAFQHEATLIERAKNEIRPVLFDRLQALESEGDPVI